MQKNMAIPQAAAAARLCDKLAVKLKFRRHVDFFRRLSIPLFRKHSTIFRKALLKTNRQSTVFSIESFL
jgi:hypothetical protein